MNGFVFIRGQGNEFEPGLGAMHEREHRDRGRDLFFGFLDAREFAVDFFPHRFVARVQFLAARALPATDDAR